MPLDGTTLGNMRAAALGVTDAAAKAAIVADSNVIISYIVANAVVSTTDTVPALGLISPGGLSPAPVTGTASGTGTGTIA